jgi:hypothetical protein
MAVEKHLLPLRVPRVLDVAMKIPSAIQASIAKTSVLGQLESGNPRQRLLAGLCSDGQHISDISPRSLCCEILRERCKLCAQFAPICWPKESKSGQLVEPILGEQSH